MDSNLKSYGKNYVEANDEIDLYEILDIVLKRKFLIIGITLLGIIFSFGAAFYYSRNLKNEKYAQDISIDYGKFNEPLLISAGDFQVVPILWLLNDDSVIEEFYTIESLKNVYENGKKENILDNEMTNKRRFLKNILSIAPILEKQDEVSFTLKKYSLSSGYKKNKKLSEDLINKFVQVVERSVDNEFKIKINKLEEFNKNIIADSQLKLKDDENSEVDEELKETKTENVDSIMKFTNPSLYASINENLKRYEESSALESKINLAKEKLNNKIVEKNTSIYNVLIKSYSMIIIIFGTLMSFLGGVFLAFILEFWNNYKKRKI